MIRETSHHAGDCIENADRDLYSFVVGQTCLYLLKQMYFLTKTMVAAD